MKGEVEVARSGRLGVGSELGKMRPRAVARRTGQRRESESWSWSWDWSWDWSWNCARSFKPEEHESLRMDRYRQRRTVNSDRELGRPTVNLWIL